MRGRAKGSGVPIDAPFTHVATFRGAHITQWRAYARREEEYMESRRRQGVSAELVWLVPKPSGGGLAVVYLEALDPERVLGELAASEAPFDSWYSGAMRKLFGFDLARLPRAGSSELLFTWCDDRVQGER